MAASKFFSDFNFKFVSYFKPAVIVTIDVPRNSNYEVLFKYALNQIQAETGKVALSNGGKDPRMKDNYIILGTLKVC